MLFRSKFIFLRAVYLVGRVHIDQVCFHCVFPVSYTHLDVYKRQEYKLAEAAYFLRTYRHKAYFSLDYDINVEREAMVLVLTPAGIFEPVSYTHLLSVYSQIGIR